MRVLVYNRADSPLFEILPSELYGLVRTEELNGPRSLTVTTTRVLAKNYRVLMVDATGRWREYVVEGVDEEHGKGAKPIGTYWCSWSMQHDLELTVVSHIPTNASVSTALGDALDGTARWSKGTITATGTATASMYEMSGWQAIGVLCENWGCEVDDQIGVDTKGVVTRKCAALSQVGSSTAKRRFDYGTDVKSIKRKVSEEPVYARVIPKGMGEETDTGYYGRRIGIESVNNNIPYLQNNDTAGSLRVPDGNGGYEYPTCYVVNSEMDTPAKLKAWAQDNLAEWTVPKVTYSADVSQFARAGLDPKGVQLGDAVQVVDSSFGSEGLRIEARVVALSINELDPADMKLTIGDAPASLSTGLTSLDGSITSIKSTVMAINGGTMATADYLGRLVDRLNYSINATGGFTYLVPGHGMLTFDVAVADPLNPVEASQVVEVKGGSIRIADSKTAQGEWEWKTVFTSGHIAGDLVTAAAITTGYIGSSGSTFIDLDNDVIQLGDQSNVWTNITSSAFDIREGSSTIMAHFGYGSGTAQSGTANAPYYTLGTRASGTVGNWSVAEGSGTVASGYISHAEGDGTTASGGGSHAEGGATTASGISSHAEGSATTASGQGSHAEGGRTTASGKWSHAEGGITVTASGESSHAEGASTTASGGGSHAEGLGTVASADGSHAQNYWTIAASNHQTAIGKWNVSDTGNNYALIIGNGTSITRSDALTVDWDGNVTPYGSVYSCMKGVDTSLATNGVTSAYYRNFGIRDKNNRYTLFCQTGAMTDGSIRAEFAARNFGTGANVTNTLRLTVNNDGSREVYVTEKEPWWDGLGLNTWTTVSLGDFATAASGWAFSTNNCNVQYNAALGALRVRIQIQTSGAQTAGQKTLFTVKTAYRPKTFAASISSLTSYAQAGQIYTNGNFAVNIIATPASTNLYFNGVYFIGA